MLTPEDKQWIEERLEQSNLKMREHLERVETTLLTEFHKWAQPVVGRVRSHTEALRTLDLELEALQGRVDKLERPRS